MITLREVSRLFLRAGCAALLMAVFALGATAQSNKGTITGTVTDPNGAVVKDAKVVVTNVADGQTRDVTTSDDGTYSIPALDPGVYRITVEASGFSQSVIEEVKLDTAARQAVDVVLTAGGVSGGTVTVTAEAQLADTETSVRGDLITGRQVTDLPITQRNFTLLAALSPGVTRPNLGLLGGGGNFVAGGGGQNNTESTRFRESGGSVMVVNGARATNNNFSLDGVDNNESQFGQIAIFPNPDAIAEFKIETSVPSAESGRAGGGIVQTTFKSGGNEVHGTAYEIYQGRFLSAAASQFDDDLTNRVPNYVTHNFGGVVGGPIFLPRFGEGGAHFYNGRNRSFFFFSTEMRRNATPIFGGDGRPAGRPRPDRADARRRLRRAAPARQPPHLPACERRHGRRAAGDDLRAQRHAHPRQRPAQLRLVRRVLQFACNYVNAFPLPNLPGAGRNFRTNRKERSNVDSYDIKIDHRITDNNSFFARYSKSKSARQRDNFFPLGASPNGNDLPAGPSAGDEFGNSNGFTMGDTHTFGPTIVNDARFGFTRVEIGIFNTGVNGTGGFDPNVSANLGARNINLGPNSSGIVLFGIVDELTGTDRATEFTGDGGPFYFLSNNFNFADAVTVVKGNSTFKFGGDLRVRQNRNYDGGRNGGTKTNTQYGTTGSGFVSGNYNGIGPNDTGSSLANFLLGYRPGFITRGDPGGPYFQSSKEIAFFVQDDWKATPTLTLNLGLRYDIFTAPTERFDQQTNFDPATRTIIVAGDGAPGGRDLAKTDKNNFGPRIGFAYSGFKADRTLVLRGGYGIVYSTDMSGQQPLTSNPGTGASSYSCNPITNPAGCPAGISSAISSTWACPTATVIVATPGARFAAPTDRRILFNDPNRQRRALPPVQPDGPVGVRAELAGRGRLRRLVGSQPAHGRATSARRAIRAAPARARCWGLTRSSPRATTAVRATTRCRRNWRSASRAASRSCRATPGRTPSTTRPAASVRTARARAIAVPTTRSGPNWSAAAPTRTSATASPSPTSYDLPFGSRARLRRQHAQRGGLLHRRLPVQQHRHAGRAGRSTTSPQRRAR